jgi:hypothetical protein
MVVSDGSEEKDKVKKLEDEIKTQKQKIESLTNIHTSLGSRTVNGVTPNNRQLKIEGEQVKLKEMYDKLDNLNGSSGGPSVGFQGSSGSGSTPKPNVGRMGSATTPVMNAADTNAMNKQVERADALAYKKMMDDYDDKIGELRSKRAEGAKDIIKGFTGSLGAASMGIAGATVGAATGEMDNIVKAAAAGIGMGDWMGEKAVEAPVAIKDFGKGVVKGVQAGREYKTLRKDLDKQKQQISKLIKDSNINAGNM